MSKEWLEWVRFTVGYKDLSLTAAHYEKLSRNGAKEIFRYLQEHIKSEEETRMIKENIEIFGMEDAAPVEEATEELSVKSTREALSQTLLEIQLAEERIKKLEKTLAKKGAERLERSTELLDMQRRATLLRGVIKRGEKQLDELDEGVQGVESFSTACLSKKDGSKKTDGAEHVQCTGCKQVDASILLQHLCSLVGESRNGSVANHSKAFTVAGARELIMQHTADCLLNAFIDCCGIKDPTTSVSNKDSEVDIQDYIQVLQRDYVELLRQIATIVEARKEVEKTVDDKGHAVVETSFNRALVPTEDLRKTLSEWVDAQLAVAGHSGELEWLNLFHDRRSSEVKETLEKEQTSLKRDFDELRRMHLQLESLESKVEDALINLRDASKELIERKSVCEDALCRFISSYMTVVALHGRIALSDSESEKCSLQLNSMKPADVFRTACLSDGSTLGDLFIPSSDNQSVVLSNARQGAVHRVATVLSDVWERVESEDGIGKTVALLNDLQSKETNVRTRTITKLMSKLESCDGPMSELQACLQRLPDAFTEWSIEEAEAARTK